MNLNQEVHTQELKIQEPKEIPQYCTWMDLYLSQQETVEGYWKILGLWNENIPKEAYTFKEPPHHEEGNTPERVVMILMMIEDHIEIEDPLKE